MANDFTSLPFVIDTVMPDGYQDTILGVPNNLLVYPRVIHWDNPTAPGDAFEIIDDVDGRILFTGTCAVAGEGGYFQVADGVRWPAQWRVSVLDSGTLNIYFTT